MWIGEKTEFKFDVATDIESGAEQPILIEQVTSAWVVTKRLRELCDAMAAARGHGTAHDEISNVLRGLDRVGIADPFVVMEDLSPDVVTERLDRFGREANNPHSAAAYVLDAALARWGYFLGHVRFEDHSRLSGIVVTHTVPKTADELAACVEPWLAHLPHDEAREAFRAAVHAAEGLEGEKCRELIELASVSVPPPTAGNSP